ncbi:Fructose dehydrogenase small subunit precursor [Aquimixticola soesokkakensis]|uniref:Fructose dehydrogenase small subunit n=1 Tax=Aquimixticola soesokkakensis TaxID=1519096 RepID=A0A1Y5RQB3_9RHOB|nr:sugar dehydrogenase complex small subunit [Aquimixticola soesokkakensis]SLN22808.1 Fructose dehydrogenase small subunit precursor [Aquimixticola soesokkakensis]
MSPAHTRLSRRQLLVSLIAIPLFSPRSVFAQTAGTDSDIARASALLTGRSTLAPETAMRVQELLSAQDAAFPSHLASLIRALETASGTDPQTLSDSLSDTDAATALAILEAWYLGYVGSVSTSSMDYDGKFVTYLQALMFEPTGDVTPRPAYSKRGANYWSAVPEGVAAPAMADNVATWGLAGLKPTTSPPDPDPAWLYMMQGYATTITAARAALAGGAAPLTSDEVNAKSLAAAQASAGAQTTGAQTSDSETREGDSK